MQNCSTASQQKTTASWYKKTWLSDSNGQQNGNWRSILRNVWCLSWPWPPRFRLFHVGWKWTSQIVQIRLRKRPGSFCRQHTEIRTPYRNYHKKWKSNGQSSVKNLRIHRWKTVSGFVYKTVVRSHLEHAAPVSEKVQRRATERIPTLAKPG